LVPFYFSDLLIDFSLFYSGLLLASMAMTLVLCKARRDSSLRRYDYQSGKNHLY
jgi:hypothetical protein